MRELLKSTEFKNLKNLENIRQVVFFLIKNKNHTERKFFFEYIHIFFQDYVVKTIIELFF